jgi:hypothetical protein
LVTTDAKVRAFGECHPLSCPLFNTGKRRSRSAIGFLRYRLRGRPRRKLEVERRRTHRNAREKTLLLARGAGGGRPRARHGLF